MPDERFSADWPFPLRLPLGAGWSGTCAAPGYVNVRPSDEELKSGCNMGYARGCPRLPSDRAADAVRFVLGEERKGLQHVYFACEREYLPAGSGELVYEVATGAWLERHPDERIQRMAECYVQVQRERRTQPVSVPTNRESKEPTSH